MTKSQRIVLVIISILVVLLVVNIFLETKKEYQTGYNFVIKRIHVNTKEYLELYNERDEGLFLSIFNLRKNDRISEGDRIYKKPCSNLLLVYRKNDYTGKYEIYLKRKANTIFPFEWFCEN